MLIYVQSKANQFFFTSAPSLIAISTFKFITYIPTFNFFFFYFDLFGAPYQIVRFSFCSFLLNLEIVLCIHKSTKTQISMLIACYYRNFSIFCEHLSLIIDK